MFRRGLALVPLLLVPACSTARQQVDRDFVKATREHVAAPKDLGLQAEPVMIPVPGAELHGLFVPARDAGGRVVVLCHGNHLNTSMTFPWYSFLHDAGFHVLTFDPRGFGQSPGEPGLQAWIQDTEAVLQWVRRRPEVDPAKVSVHGIGLGGVAALYASGRTRGIAGIVLESLISPREHIRAAFGDGLGAAMQTGFVEASGMPPGAEPEEAVLRSEAPVLLLCGERERLLDRRANLRVALVAGPRAALWLLPDTEASPNAMLTHDGEYQRAVVDFLKGTPPQPELAVAWQTAAPGDGGLWLDVTVRRAAGAGAAEPWAVQICAADRDANLTFHRVWLEGAEGRFRLKVPAEPGLCTATRYAAVLGDEAGAGWRRARTERARAGELWEVIRADADLLKNGEPSLAQARQVADRLQALETAQPFPADLDARAAETWYLLGRRLCDSTEAEDRARGVIWLRRAIGAEPKQPRTWVWPGADTLFGWPHADAAQRARDLLARIEGR